MRVVLDSCIIVADPRLDGTQFHVLLTSAREIGATVLVPQVVLDEVCEKQRRRLLEIRDEWRKLYAKTTQLVGRGKLPELEVFETAENYEEYLRTRLRQYRCEILPYPTVSHARVVARILEGRRPFHQGERGYRDYLIWDSIVDLARNGEEAVAFITSNTRDFGTAQPHEHFLDDLRGANAIAKVSLFESLSSFNAQHVLPALKTITELRERFNNDTEARFSVQKWSRSTLFDFLRENDFEDGFSPFVPSHARARLSKLVDAHETQVDRVLLLQDGDFLVRATTRLTVEMSLGASWDDLRHEDVRDFFLDHNDSSDVSAFDWADCDLPVTARVSYSLLLRKDSLTLESVDIDQVSGEFGKVVYNTGEFGGGKTG